MFSFNSSHRFEYYVKACDMRKGFDSLCGLVRNELGRNPLSGDVFVFVNKSRSTIKLLHWDSDGFVIYHKRLESGRFALPYLQANTSRLMWPELVLMLEGIKPVCLVRPPRFSLHE